MINTIIMETISLTKILKSYPNCKILGIHEAYFPNVKQGPNWIPQIQTENQLTQTDIVNKIKHCISLGATHINFKIVDEWEATRFPDFNTNELISK